MAWARASDIERGALCHTAGLDEHASPAEVFTTIARQAPHLDPRLTALLWDELDLKFRTRAVTINDMPLSDPMAEALNIALAYELGQRIDRVLAELGTDYDHILQTDVEAAARRAGIPYPVISYALGRKESGA